MTGEEVKKRIRMGRFKPMRRMLVQIGLKHVPIEFFLIRQGLTERFFVWRLQLSDRNEDTW